MRAPAILYVSAWGRDARPNAFASLADAIASVVPGDAISVEPKDFDNIRWNLDLISGEGFEFVLIENAFEMTSAGELADLIRLRWPGAEVKRSRLPLSYAVPGTYL